jgi:hypothetical protein
MSASLPDGVFHLLAADDTVHQTYGTYVTVCGEDVPVSDLPPSCYSEEGREAARDPQYCLECVPEAARWNAESGQARPPTDT